MSELVDYCHGLQEGARAIVTYLSPQNKCPSAPERPVRELSRAPSYVKAWKESSFRRAAIRVLALARSYYPTVVAPDLLTLGRPEQHEDGSPLTKEEFDSLQKTLRPFACEIVQKMDSEIWTHQYDSNNKKIVMETPPVVDFGLPSQSNVGASTSTGPVLSTPAAPTPARPEDGGNSQRCEEGAAQSKKNSSAPQSSAQGTAANAPTAGQAHAQEDIPTQKDHPLDDY